MSRWMGYSLLMACAAGIGGVGFWQATAGEWVGASIFYFLAGVASGLASALLIYPSHDQ